VRSATFWKQEFKGSAPVSLATVGLHTEYALYKMPAVFAPKRSVVPAKQSVFTKLSRGRSVRSGATSGELDGVLDKFKYETQLSINTAFADLRKEMQLSGAGLTNEMKLSHADLRNEMKLTINTAVADLRISNEKAVSESRALSVSAITEAKLAEERARSDFSLKLLRQQFLVAAFFVLSLTGASPDSLAGKFFTLVVTQLFK